MKTESDLYIMALMVFAIVFVLFFIGLTSRGMFNLGLFNSAESVGGVSVYKDMSLTDILWEPQNPDTDTFVVVKGRLTNTGNITLNGSVEFYIWYDNFPGQGKNYTLDGNLLPGFSVIVNVDVHRFSEGSHNIRMRIKPRFQDNNPSNNERSELIYIEHSYCSGLCDVGLDDIIWVPENPHNNTMISIGGRLMNWEESIIERGAKISFEIWYDNVQQPEINYTLDEDLQPHNSIDAYVDNTFLSEGIHEVRMQIIPRFSDDDGMNNFRIKTIPVLP